MVILPPRFSKAAEDVVVAVTSALIIRSPSTVPMQVLVEVALTGPLIVSPVCALIAMYEVGIVALPEIVIEPAFA